MATLKKEIKPNTERVNITCVVHHPDEPITCIDCEHGMATKMFCDLKCELKNHYVNQKTPGYVCKDYKKRSSNDL